jgi:hypothetical protein
MSNESGETGGNGSILPQDTNLDIINRDWKMKKALHSFPSRFEPCGFYYKAGWREITI